jgi:GT2 family glycosyltransferase
MPLPISVAIPTYGRDQVLVDTVQSLTSSGRPPAELMILDQTEHHDECTMRSLREWHSEGVIRWIRLPEPSIPGAMNQGLLDATHEIVLFLDDDIVPELGLLQAHVRAHERVHASLVAGRVIQPWQEGANFPPGGEFHFASVSPGYINEFMAGNFSVRRDVACKLGGFDERFVRVAYHFEAEFAHRLRKAGHRIYYEPSACIHHLRVSAGGTRSFGEHLRSAKPNHAVGAYYFFLRTWSGWHSLLRFLGRPIRAVATRHHLRRPWWIPATLCAELAGMVWALALAVRGPQYLTSREDAAPRISSKSVIP